MLLSFDVNLKLPIFLFKNLLLLIGNFPNSADKRVMNCYYFLRWSSIWQR
uniref:Uncharacterized protein n=1 Tax=Anguilla anguilla TaxID=7936 RepID=A0A0E9TMV3_ANGAN